MFSDSSKENSSSDVVNFKMLLNIFFEQKKVILVVFSFFLVLSFIYIFFANNVYRSDITFIQSENLADKNNQDIFSGFPIGGLLGLESSSRNEDISISVLESKIFLYKFLREENLLIKLYEDEWSEDSNSWIDEEPSMEDSYNEFRDRINLTKNLKTGIHTLSVSWKDPVYSSYLSNKLIESLNSYTSEKAIKRSERNLKFLENELVNTKNKTTSDLISKLIESSLSEKMLASNNEEFTFEVIDPAIPSERPYSPKKLLIVSISSILGIFFGIIASLVLFFLKTENK